MRPIVALKPSRKESNYPSSCSESGVSTGLSGPVMGDEAQSGVRDTSLVDFSILPNKSL